MEVVTLTNNIFKTIYTICSSVIKLASAAKANKKSCRRLSDRVTALRGVVQSIERQGHASERVTTALRQLSYKLTVAEYLVEKCKGKINPFKIMKRKKEFSEINERLSDTFEELSGALHVENGSMALACRPTQNWFLDDDDDDDDEDGLAGQAFIEYYEAMIVEDDVLFYVRLFYMGM